MEVETFAMVVGPFCLKTISYQGGEISDQIDGLPQNIGNGQIIRIFVVGIQGENTSRQLVHHVSARGNQDHVSGKSRREFAPGSQGGAVRVQLFLGGQLSEEKQVAGFFVAETVLFSYVFHQVIDINAPVIQLTFRGHFFIVFVDGVSDNLSNFGKPYNNTCAIGISQAPFYIVFSI